MVEPAVRTVCYVERDLFAASVLVARMEEAALDTAPIWDDLESFPSKQWRGQIDCVIGGIPCQPWSQAGGRRGVNDHRHLWPYVVTLIRDLGVNCIFLENVPGILTAGLGYILGDLANIGFHAEWGVFSCAEMGAPHRRRRVFILAYSGGSGLQISSKQVDMEKLETAKRGSGSIYPPGPDGNWRSLNCELWPAIKPPVRRMAYGAPIKLDSSFFTDRLRSVGNAVSPQVAGAAWIELHRRFRGG